jgi:hypothetical protein
VPPGMPTRVARKSAGTVKNFTLRMITPLARPEASRNFYPVHPEVLVDLQGGGAGRRVWARGLHDNSVGRVP